MPRKVSAPPGVGVGPVQNIPAVGLPLEWTLHSLPAVNTRATATRPAAGPGVRNVLTGLLARVNTVAAQAAPVTVVVRDGPATTGPILWQDRLSGAIATNCSTQLAGVNIVGSPNTPMTVEFTATPATNNFENVAATGYSLKS